VALKALQGAGVQVLLQTQPLDFGRDAECHARLQTPAGPLRLGFDLLLLALGRQPNLQGLGLQELGLSHLQLDAYLQTPIPGIYAAGDVTEQWQLTHAAAHQGWHAAVHALQGLRRFRADRAPMPQTLFLDPEIARVGLNEQQARGLAHEVTRFELAELDRAIIEGQREGYVKLITAAGSGRLLGATVVGPHAGELLAEYTLALQQGLSLRQLLAGIRAYPTWSEANKYAVGAFVRGRQPAWALRWLERYHAWRRG
jgi:pyruvate/2-oxoglutarate dehydrogenase complex dihydrolipoamide dehydrogenase (E3) component